MARGVEPDVHGRRALRDADAADPLGHEAEGAAEARAREGIFLAIPGGHEELVGLAAGERAQEDEPVALRDDADPLFELAREDAAEDAAALGRLRASLLADEGRLFLQPDELRVRVLEARAGRASLVDEDVDIGKTLLAGGGGPGLPRFGDELELAEREVGERAYVARGVHDDFLTPAGSAPGEQPRLIACVRPWPERRELVRNDANAPAGCVGRAPRRAEREALRRRRALAPFAERAAGDVVGLLFRRAIGARPP